MDKRRLEIATSPDGELGDLGFKLTGESSERPGRFVRVWVRRKKGEDRHVWNRYLSPIPDSKIWEVRLHEHKGTGAMTRVPFELETLERFAEEYSFPHDSEAAGRLMSISVDDPLFNTVRDWAIRATATFAEAVPSTSAMPAAQGSSTTDPA